MDSVPWLLLCKCLFSYIQTYICTYYGKFEYKATLWTNSLAQLNYIQLINEILFWNFKQKLETLYNFGWLFLILVEVWDILAFTYLPMLDNHVLYRGDKQKGKYLWTCYMLKG